MNRRQLLKRLTQGSLHNIPFSDIVNLIEGFGFRLARISGSHHIFTHPNINELINFQSVQGETKPYQIRQLLRIVERYNLRLEEEE